MGWLYFAYVHVIYRTPRYRDTRRNRFKYFCRGIICTISSNFKLVMFRLFSMSLSQYNVKKEQISISHIADRTELRVVLVHATEPFNFVRCWKVFIHEKCIVRTANFYSTLLKYDDSGVTINIVKYPSCLHITIMNCLSDNIYCISIASFNTYILII